MGLVYSAELLGESEVGGEVAGGDGVGNQGKEKEHPLEHRARLISANEIRIYPIFFNILSVGLLYHRYFKPKNFALRALSEMT